MAENETAWWLSFAEDKENGGFRGACIVEAPSFLLAVKVSHALGINPGGQVAGWEVPVEAAREALPAGLWNRLLTKDEIPEPLTMDEIDKLEEAQ